MKAIVGYCLGILAAVTTHVSAQCVQLQAGQTALLFGTSGTSTTLPTPGGATGLVAFLPSAANQNQIEKVVATAPAIPGQPLTVNDAFVQAVMQNTAERSRYRVAFVGTGNALITPTPFPFFLTPFESNAACAAKPSATPLKPAAPQQPAGLSPANALDCDKVASARNITDAELRGKYEGWVLFNSTGALCFANYPLRQRDKLSFGMVFRRGETIPPGISVNMTNCATPTPQPTTYGDLSKAKEINFQSTAAAQDEFVFLPIGTATECASDSPIAKVSIPQEDGKILTRDQTLKLFPRYNAVFHVGVLQSKLHKTDYRVENSIIVNKEPEDRGPEYVAMVVIQALPKALSGVFSPGKPSYQGRDLIHDNDFGDRLGLAMAFGLQEPGSRFGLGLSYELARGVNVVGIHEWVKRTRLNGVSVGETFTGTDLPTRKQWDKGWSLGLTLDIEYITKVFGGSGK